jgi:hypothetical protein
MASSRLREPKWAQYDAEKQRILREYGRQAMLAFAKAEHLQDFLAEIGELGADEGTPRPPVELRVVAAVRMDSYATFFSDATDEASGRRAATSEGMCT